MNFGLGLILGLSLVAEILGGSIYHGMSKILRNLEIFQHNNFQRMTDTCIPSVH